ncbi:MAG: lipid II flippase MurJ, partial [Planctomycetota bacterium]
MTSEPPAQTPDPATTGQLAGAVRTVSGLTLASRLLGLVRDLITARLFLDTPIGSAFAAAFALPNLFRRLFGEGALSAAFIPEYASAQQADAERAGTEAAGLEGNDASQANAIARFTLRLTIMITAALTLLGEAVLIGLLLTLPADDNRDFSLALMAVMLPFMPLVCIAAVLGGILQSHHRFAPTAAAPIVLNLCIIAAALPALLIADITPRTAAYAVAIATLVAGALQ